MFNTLKSAAVAVLVASAVAVAGVPVVTFQAHAADAPPAKADSAKKMTKKKTAAKKKTTAKKKMDNMSK